MATEYATLTFVADTSGLERADKQLNAISRTGTRTQRSVDGVSTAARSAGQSFSGLGRNAAQASVQIKSIIGPADTSAGSLLRLNNQANRAGVAAAKTGANVAGMGRNAGQAGIQVQQLVGQVQAGTNPLVAFSQQATDLGIVLGVPLLGAVAGLGSALVTSLIPALIGTGDEMDELGSDIDKIIDNMDEFTEAQRAAAAIKVSEDLREQQKEYERTAKRIEALETRLATAGENTRSLFDNMRPEEVQELRNEITLAKGSLDTQAQSLERLQEQYDILTGVQDAATESTNEGASAGERFVDRLREQADTLGMTRSEALLYKAAQMDLTDAQMLQVRASAELIRQYEEEQAALEDRQRAENAAWLEIKRQHEARQEAIRQIREFGMSDEQASPFAEIFEPFEQIDERRKKLENFRQQDLISERQYQNAKAELDKQTNKAVVDTGFDTLETLGRYNKEAFQAAKAYNIAQAIMNTYTAATKALASLPPPINYVAAAAVTAAGIAQVDAIRSQQFQGRAVGGQTRAGESYVVGERGPEVLTMGSSNGRVIPNEALRRAEDGQGASQTTNVTFNINTVDARGFDQLLQSRRGQIISMINSASNDRGRRAVV